MEALRAKTKEETSRIKTFPWRRSVTTCTSLPQKIKTICVSYFKSPILSFQRTTFGRQKAFFEIWVDDDVVGVMCLHPLFSSWPLGQQQVWDTSCPQPPLAPPPRQPILDKKATQIQNQDVMQKFRKVLALGALFFPLVVVGSLSFGCWEYLSQS